MNNINFNLQMSEETFKEVLDVLEKRFASLRILDCGPEYKLSKSSNLSELRSPFKSQGFLFRKAYHSGSCEHNWEEYFNANLSTRQVKDSHHQIKLSDNELHNLRKNTTTLIEFDVTKRSGESMENIKKAGKPEYMEVEESSADKPYLSSRIGPKKSYPSFFPIQPRPSTFSVVARPSSAAPTSESYIPLPSTLSLETKPLPTVSTSISSLNIHESSLSRKSHSDITNDLKTQENTDVFNVSKSFGKFSFSQNQLNDSKETAEFLKNSEKKPETANKNLALKGISDIKQDLEKEKKKLRPLMQEKKKRPNYICSCWQIIFFLLLPVAVILISATLNQQEVGSKFCNPAFNFTNVTENLPKLVHGQTQSIKELTNFLELENSKFKVVALVGGTGVGKSHVANIIKDSVPENYYTFEYFPPVYNKIRLAYSKLSMCRCNVIILENLGTEDISDAAFFSHSLRNRASDLCVLILALFNTQITDNNLRRSLDLKGSVQKIEDDFKKEEINVKAVSFEPLQEESIVKCIKDAIVDSHLKISEEDINQIKESLLIANSGCKGAYSKVQLFGKAMD